MGINNIFDFLNIKNTVKRSYGKPEQIEEENGISKMPVTLTSENGKDLVAYLLVKKVSQDKRNNNNNNVMTLSNKVYKGIEVEDGVIVCERFDDETPVIFDLEGQRLTPDSKLTLGDFD